MFGGDVGGNRTTIAATATMDIGMTTMIGLTVAIGTGTATMVRAGGVTVGVAVGITTTNNEPAGGNRQAGSDSCDGDQRAPI